MLHNTPALKPIWPIVNMAYATSSDLLLDSLPLLTSSNGVRQGDPLSSLLFCFYIKDVLASVSALNVRPYACIDDIHLVGKPDDLLVAFLELRRQFDILGLTINAAKSHLADFHHLTQPISLSDTSPCPWADLSIPVDHHRLRVLGAAVAADERQLSEEVGAIVSSGQAASPFFRRLLCPVITTQVATLLLRECGTPKMSYLARCTPPPCLAAVAAKFDQTVVDTAFAKLNIVGDERSVEAVNCLRRPLPLGGFGLTSVLQSSPASYIASLASVAVHAKSFPAITGADGSERPLSPASSLHGWIESSLTSIQGTFAQLHAAVPNAPASDALGRLPPSASVFFPDFKADQQAAVHLRRDLVQQAANLRFDAAVMSTTGEEPEELMRRARYVAYSAPHAHKWKTVIPSQHAHTLSDTHYTIAARLNLGLTPFPNKPAPDCASCREVDALRTDSSHHLCCIAHKSREITLRHNTIVQTLYHHTIHAGGAAVKEPRHLSTETRKRPDLQIVLPNRHILTDVVVTHPLAPSYFRATGKEHLIKAKHAAAAKCRKYAEVADSQQADFIPFSIESTGGIGKEAADLIDQLCTASRDFLSLPSHHPFAHDVFSSVAIAIQRGNAFALIAGDRHAVMEARKRESLQT